jgi:DNA-binding protein H-NS
MNDLTTSTVDDLTTLSIKELIKLQENINKAIELRKVADRKELIKTFMAMAQESGFTLDELLADTTVPTKNKKERAEPKYRHPEDHSQTWSGNGRKPGWLVALLDDGKQLEDFAI